MKITKQLIKKAYDLSRAGFNNKTIYESLDISKSAFYSNMDLMDTIKKAKSELREEVSKSLLNNAKTGDTTSLIFLAKRLNLFSEDIHIKLSNPMSALKSLEEVANANISLEHKNCLKSIIHDYIKSYEILELEQRISKLEEIQQ